jgi:hypothetical protein
MLICIAARVLEQPVVPVEGTKPVAAQETSRPATSEVAVITSTAEAAPKPAKRNSLFGSLWGKKESSSKDAVPTIATKEPETTPVSATAPRIEEPINPTSTASGTVAPAPPPVAEPSESSPVATTSPAVSPSTPSTDKRRSSFFNALGGKKEKKVEGSPDTEGVDGEGKKSNTGKFTGLFRKPSRATPPAHGEKSPTGAEHGPLTTVAEPVVGDSKSPVVTSA